MVVPYTKQVSLLFLASSNMYRKSKRKQQTEPSALPCFIRIYIELLNDVIEPVMFACSVGLGGDVCTMHIYVYIHTRGLRSMVPLV